MKENNENMKQFAQPNFPAQDAWNGMQKILNTEMPVEEKPKKRFVFFWLLGLILLGTGAYFYIDKNSTKLADANTIKFNDTNTFKESITNAILENKSINSASENGAITKSNASVSQSAATANRIENIANSNPIIASKSYSNTFKGIAFNANHFNKLGYEKASNILFANAPSFNDIRRMKIAKGEVSFENAITDNFIAETIADTDVSKNVMINPTKESVKESKIKSITKPIQNAIAESAVKMPKNMNLQTLHYGLQWNVVLPQTNSYLNYNAQSQPITIAIPEFWVSKHLSRKSELSLQLNPYSQYTLKGNNVLASTNYPITISFNFFINNCCT